MRLDYCKILGNSINDRLAIFRRTYQILVFKSLEDLDHLGMFSGNFPLMKNLFFMFLLRIT